jgi:hypothetical protein
LIRYRWSAPAEQVAALHSAVQTLIEGFGGELYASEVTAGPDLVPAAQRLAGDPRETAEPRSVMTDTESDPDDWPVYLRTGPISGKANSRQ